VIARPARRSWVGYGEEPADHCNVVGPVGIGEESVVTDAMSAKIAIAIVRNRP
jgi:hypothetical protein